MQIQPVATTPGRFVPLADLEGWEAVESRSARALCACGPKRRLAARCFSGVGVPPDGIVLPAPAPAGPPPGGRIEHSCVHVRLPQSAVPDL